jgi:chromosome segregation ATPase
MNQIHRAAIVALGLAALMGATAQAQQARSGGGNENGALLQQLQQLGSERTELQAQNAKLQSDLDAMRKERDTLKAAQGGSAKQKDALEAGMRRAQQSVAAVAAQRQSDERELTQSREQTQQLITKMRETIVALQGVEIERSKAITQLNQANVAYAKCAQDNYSIYEVTEDVLKRYEHQGVFTSISRSEPFTGIAQNRIENLVLDYRQKVEDLRVKAPGSQATPATGTDKDAPAGMQFRTDREGH